MASTQELIAQIYIGFYDRAPDPVGLQYWVGRVNAGVSIQDIGDSFAASPEASDTYPYFMFPELLSPNDFLAQVYQNVFGRAIDADGLNYYSGRMAAGESAGSVVASILGNASTNEGSPDQAYLQNKVDAGLYWSMEAATSGADIYQDNGRLTDAAAASSHGVIDGVDADPATVVEANAESDAFFGGGGGADNPITLTTDIDTLVGTSGNDAFIGLQDTADDTFTVADSIDGGAGTDTLRITTTGMSATPNEVDLSIADIVNVENVDLRINDVNFDTVNLDDASNAFHSVSLDFRGHEQVQDVDVNNFNVNAAATVSNIETDGFGIFIDFESNDSGSVDPINGSMTISNTDDAYVYVDLDSAGDGTSDSDVYTLTLDNVQNSNNNAYFEIDSVETLNVHVVSDSELDGAYVYYTNSTGDLGDQTINFQLDGDLTILSDLDTTDTGDATFNITGAGDLTIGDWGSADENLTFNAGTATGDIDIAGINDDAESVTATFGSGDDRITFDDGIDLSTVTADGGSGIDTFGVDGDDVANIGQAALTSFETLDLTGAAGAAVTIDADDNGFDNLVLSVNVGVDVTAEDLSGDLTIEASQTGIVTITPEGTSDDLAVSLDDAGGTVTLTNLDVSDYTSVDFTTVTNTDGDDTDVTFTQLTVDGVDNVSFTGEGDVVVNGLSANGLDSLDLSGLTGSFSNAAATLNSDGVNIAVGNLGSADGAASTSTIALDGTDAATDVLEFGSALDGDLNVDNFTTGSGLTTHDVLDLSGLGVASLAELTFTDTGGDVAITSTAAAADFDGTITLVGVPDISDLEAANFVFG